MKPVPDAGVMKTYPVRRLLVALCTMLAAAAVLLATRPASAAQVRTDFDVDVKYNDIPGGYSLRLNVYNNGPDNPGYEVIAWYSVVIEFPTQSTPLPTGTPCDQLEYEFRGSYEVGICTIHGDDHADLPVGLRKTIFLDFVGTPTACDPVRTVTVTLRLDALLRDPTPVHKVQQISGGIGGCGLA